LWGCANVRFSQKPVALTVGPIRSKSSSDRMTSAISDKAPKIISFQMSAARNPIRPGIERWFDPSDIDPLSET
jgi:hypothetical protein